jgi:hypothetical protein
VEYLNLEMAYHYFANDNNADLQLKITGPGQMTENIDDNRMEDPTILRKDPLSAKNSITKDTSTEYEKYVDFESAKLDLRCQDVPSPHCVYPLLPSRQDFTHHTCDIVTSYEDLTFCISLANKFLKVDSSLSHRSADSSSANSPPHDNSGGGNTTSNGSAQDKKDATQAMNPMDSSGESSPPVSLFSVFSISSIRFMIVDNVLGLHSPLIQVNNIIK